MKSPKKDHWVHVVKAKEKKKPTVNSYPPELRGFAQNRFGGQQTQRLKTYGGKFGAAGPVRRLNSKERRAIEADLRERGII